MTAPVKGLTWRHCDHARGHADMKPCPCPMRVNTLHAFYRFCIGK